MATYVSFGIQESKFASTALYARLTSCVTDCDQRAMLRCRNSLATSPIQNIAGPKKQKSRLSGGSSKFL